MKTKPHAIFTRNLFGVVATIEINPGTSACAVIRDGNRIPLQDSIRITKGITPGWAYAAGLDTSHWHDAWSYVYVGTEDSYITSLRRVVTWLTGGYCSGKPRLGYHSAYREAKRNARKVA